jgi:FkbM family methyltransferase
MSEKYRKENSSTVSKYRYLICLLPLIYAIIGVAVVASNRSGSSGPSLVGSIPRNFFSATSLSSKSCEPEYPVPPPPSVERMMVKFFDGLQVVTYSHVQPGTASNWWSVVNHNVWEADTLRTIKLMLTRHKNSNYVDFGAWVGPTALFASSYAKHVYALEPDPGAYQELYWNVKMNPNVLSKITTFPMCIADKPGTILMHGIIGSSMPSLLDDPNAEQHRRDNTTGYADFPVECTTLDLWMNKQGLTAKDVALIKMDTEGGETKIFKQLASWIALNKPNILLSLHAFLFREDVESHNAIKKVIQMYSNPIWLDGKPVDKENIKIADDCYLCAMLLTDEVVTAADLESMGV